MADATRDLFGSDDSDEEQQAPAAKASAAEDKRAKLEALRNKKRKELEAEAAEAQREKQAKKQRRREAEPDAAGIDFGDSDEDDEDYDAAADEAQPAGGGGGADAAAELAADGEEDEEEKERRMVASDADRDFIDDAELAPDDRIDFGDDDEQEAAIQAAEEAAESDDELERLFSKGRRRGGREEGGRGAAESKAAVENLLAQMEVAAEEDLREYEAGRPAVHKLRMLQRVEEMLSTKRLHSELLDGGLLGVLKAWLEPLPDGALPNSKVRGTVLRLLGALPVDCSQEDRKEQLKRSGLGRVVMFLYKVPDETAANRRMAKELIERWSRPILAPRGRGMEPEEQQRILEARQARQARMAAERAAAEAGGGAGEGGDGDDMQREVLKPGAPGFRWHAAVPQAASLDYVRLPASQYAMPEKKQGGGKDKGQHKLSKKLADLKKKGARTGRAANVSVEGRNVNVSGP